MRTLAAIFGVGMYGLAGLNVAVALGAIALGMPWLALVAVPASLLAARLGASVLDELVGVRD